MNTELKIIGLAGTNGSGKDSIGQVLANYHNYLFISVTEILRDELKKQGLAISRENLRALSAQWRQERGLGVLMDMAIDTYHETGHKYSGVVISSLRNPGEVDSVHKLGGVVVWVDAEPRMRYERVQANAAARARDTEDKISYEQFLGDEAAEMNQSLKSDNTALNMSAVKDLCDIFIENSGQDIAGLRKMVEKALGF
jgi:cytidylate kinase